MPGPTRVVGYAIISADGMLADARGQIPDTLKIAADQEFFFAGLREMAAVVQGRNSAEGGPDEAGRLRLIATRTVAGIARDPARPLALLWNPNGATLAEAWTALAPAGDALGVIGGSEVYDLFLTIGYGAFHLTRVPNVRLPGGRPVFTQIGPQRTPEAVLADHGLRPGPPRILDGRTGATLVSWTR